MSQNFRGILSIVGPGILVAATGVGAGDLATAAFTGNRLGVVVLWAVIVGALLKYTINEGLTRFQLATGDTLLEGCVEQFGRPFRWFFLVYLVLWSFLVGLALMSACGATLHAMHPIWSANQDKIFYGILQSLTALVLVQIGGFKLFEKVMTVCVGIMFVVVIATAVALRPSVGAILSGLFVPRIPDFYGEGGQWTIALIGGVGGTLTVMCYGYWIRELGRRDSTTLGICRIDLATGYVMTAVFGISMVIIGSQTESLEGKGSSLLVSLSSALVDVFGSGGEWARWAFLLGAWGAVFSSLLGVWQSVPYLFADFWSLSTRQRLADGSRPPVDTSSKAYRGYLYGLAILPSIGLWTVSFTTAQKVYAIVGALVIPLLSIVLLILNNRSTLVGERMKNSWLTNVLLLITVLFFAAFGWLTIKAKFGW